MPTTEAPDPAAAGRPAPADPTRFVLVRPTHAGNVGAAARAIKVMGFGQLVLVQPRHADVLAAPEALAFASGALDVLEAAQVVQTLDDALAGSTHVCATAMTPRDFGPPTFAPRPHFEALARSGECLALVFGPERTGLDNDSVYRCDACVSIPAAPGYASLNLAQAVQLLAYEWRQALGGFPVQPRAAVARRADAAAVEGTLQHWSAVLQRIGFLDPRAPKKLVPRLRRLLLRAEPTGEEVHILRGMARAVDQAVDPSVDAGAAAAPARTRGERSAE